ncbi:MAG: hypothetical protein OXI38_14330 [Bacteroidota bacterium]|nr:hypothetical protein [Bacteroidota bacterium]
MIIHTATHEEVLAVLNNIKDLPTPVSDWLVEVGTDWINEPAVKVWVILERDDVEFDATFIVRTLVQDSVMALMGPAYYVYVRFRTASEMAELAAPSKN